MPSVQTQSASRLMRHADQLWEYEPLAVMRPSGGALGLYSGDALLKLVRNDLKAQNLFYDIFRARNGKEVVALQAAEFAEKFPPVEAHCGGKRMGARYSVVYTNFFERIRPRDLRGAHGKILILWSFSVPRGMPADRPLPLELRLGDERLPLELPPSPFANWRKVSLTQHTVQKDYPLEWIRDHCLFHHRAHGYGRIVVYDNDSDYYGELVRMLGGLDAGLEVLLVRWPFKMHRRRMHGVDLPGGVRVKGDSYAQQAAYNHGFRMLGDLTGHATNLDLDEYLYSHAGKDLASYMARKTWLVPCRLMDSERVENVVEERHLQPVRAAHFGHQTRDPKERYRDGPIKYFYRASGGLLKTEYMTQHHIRYRMDVLFAAAGFLLNRIRRRLLRTPIGRGLRLRPRSHSAAVPIAHPREIVMYHYNGIRTDWDHVIYGSPKGTLVFRPQELNPDMHLPFNEMPQLLKSVGLGD